VGSYYEKFAAEQAAKRVNGVRAVVNDLQVQLGKGGITDEEIAIKAVDALRWNVLVPSKRIQVTVSRGWLTLEGSVKWRFQKEAAEDTVRNLEGVIGVSNRIRISPRVDPMELQASIEDALRRSAELQARQITVQTDGGKVILRGTVRSVAEREEAERQAWAAPGVREVENLLMVEP
jgi:osmotically-inducible protein OsmY